MRDSLLSRMFFNAKAETLRYWTEYRVLTFIASPIIGALWGWQGLTWIAVLSIAVRSAVIFFALWGVTFFYSLLRAPAVLDKKLREENEGLQETASQLNKDIAGLRQKLQNPTSTSSAAMDKVREGWATLKPHEQKAVGLLLEYGDMTDRNAMNRLNIHNLGNMFPTIEEKTNFVHRTVQGIQEGEMHWGYQGTWTINPHFKDALRQLIGVHP